MKLVTTTAPAFTLEPTLPWLRTDPAMQQPEAFVSMRTVELHKDGWAPMGLYFPGGAVLAAVQIHKIDDLTPGVYWHETKHPEGNGGEYTSYNFGRFEGFGELSPSQARRYKKGQAHIELGADTLECNLREHGLREDGTVTCYVDFGHDHTSGYQRKIWRITHYVDVPYNALLSLGEDSYGIPTLVDSVGVTEDQERWLEEEKQLRTREQCSEYSAYVLGDFPEVKHRAVLRGEVSGCFGQLFGHTPTITASQAKKRKSGAVAITWRSYAYDGQPIGYTQYYKLEDARVMLDYLQGRAEEERATSRVAAAKSALLSASADIDEAIEASIMKQAEVVKSEPRRELALAA